MSAHEWLRDYLKEAGSAQIGKLWQCPAHPDSYPSMSLDQGEDGRALIYCYAGCSFDEICSALGIEPRLLFERHPWSAKKVFQTNPAKPSFSKISLSGHGGGNKRRMDFYYQYHQFTPTIRLERVKYEDGTKSCRWQFLEGNSWYYSRDNKIDLDELPMYRENEVIQGSFLDEIVVLCESESSVDALFNIGIYVTTWAGGASQPKVSRLKSVLGGMRVLWVPDNDPAGLKCSRTLEAELKPVVRQWSTLMGEEGEDARDLVKRSALTLETVTRLFSEAASVTR